MYYLKTHQKDGLLITSSLLHNKGDLTLDLSLQNLSESPLLLRMNPFTQSPFTLSLSPSFFTFYRPNDTVLIPQSENTFRFKRLQHEGVITKRFAFSLSKDSNMDNSSVLTIEAGYTPFGDGAWGEFPHVLTTYFSIQKSR
ncbi:hypothetical protein CN918_25785 [Priestia megaterium]|nr:hypothetical protein CN918_25785 [Priestia megaterium]